jgi:glycerol uptake facilitator-like aquaporin
MVRPFAFPLKKVIPYWIAQVCGATLAGLTNFLLFYRAIERYEEENLSSFKGKSGNGVCKSPQQCTEYDRQYLKSASAFGNYWR